MDSTHDKHATSAQARGDDPAAMADSDALMGIADMCAAFDVSPRTLRFYETKGLLAPRRINGTRVYSKVDRARLSRILRAKSLGMPLAEIKAYLDMYGDHGEGRVQQLSYVIEMTGNAIRDLEAKRAEIDTSLAELRLIHERSRQMLEAKRKGRSGA
ncbi:MAG TPA: MerR family DNA-binding transcriptional regulator [Aquabacterium sp.]|uniref:MerR family transcriptional regulator n=1 Tax=Aquabacterium sp. TaxID=1872578 RepID=UPI002DA2748A|nr:MerR family DNA-binding transcriptional regulator [Aquabacterium sp.]HET6786558.1 MerR family DNA-binding transcriptional regulator [Aquabacterium sp.]HEX5371330.1 MerR family DNA-binding transcriptional regulator [Aquabacterium sp.]